MRRARSVVDRTHLHQSAPGHVTAISNRASLPAVIACTWPSQHEATFLMRTRWSSTAKTTHGHAPRSGAALGSAWVCTLRHTSDNHGVREPQVPGPIPAGGSARLSFWRNTERSPRDQKVIANRHVARIVRPREHVIGRRAFLGAAGATLAAACAPSPSFGADSPAPSLGPPETTTVRIALTPACDPWYWLSEPFLREEGFSDIRYGAGAPDNGTADFGVIYGTTLAAAVDAGVPLLAVAGTHTGCIELWARPNITTIADLRGKTIAVNQKNFTVAGNTATDLAYGFLVSLLAYVGMQPGDVHFIEIGADQSVTTFFVDGKADAILTAGVNGPLLHATKGNPGRVILDSSADKPWSQYYCCLLVTNRTWAAAHPVALKRATRAILRAIDAGNRDLHATAKAAIDKGVYKPPPVLTEGLIYDVIKDMSFDWREYDPEETMRFFALRLGDARLIRKTAAQVIADGTDFAYFRRLQKELSG